MLHLHFVGSAVDLQNLGVARELLHELSPAAVKEFIEGEIAMGEEDTPILDGAGRERVDFFQKNIFCFFFKSLEKNDFLVAQTHLKIV